MISDAIPSVSVKKKFNLIAINLYLNRGKGKSIKGQRNVPKNLVQNAVFKADIYGEVNCPNGSDTRCRVQ